MFTLINYIETPVIELYMGAGYDNYVVITNIITSVSAIGGGLLCDLKGRKIAAILGFVFLGGGLCNTECLYRSVRPRSNVPGFSCFLTASLGEFYM